MHDLGDPYLSRFDNTVDGSLTAATTAVLTVTLPDGTTTAPAVTQPTVGRYQATYTPVQVGHHRLRWVSTGPGARAQSDALNVQDGAGSLLSLAEARAHLNVDEDDRVDDEELRGYIAAATAVVERHTGEAVVRRTVVEDHRVPGTTSLVLRNAPVVSVTSVASPDGTAVWLVADFTVDTFAGVLTGPYLSGLVRVTYVAGQPVVPANYLLAAQIIVSHLWQTQRWSSLGRQPGFDGEEVLTPSGLGYAIPARAVELLGARGAEPAMTAALPVASAIPAALDALVAGVERSPHLGGWQVLDGEVNRELRKDWVAIGLSPDDLDIEATRIVAGLGSDLESFSILGLVRSWSGSGLVKPRRDRAFAALAAVHAVLVADRRLGGAVTRARLAQVVYVPIRTTAGVGVELPFRVDVNAHSTPT